jgi:uncharacterized membrane protein YkoI
MKTKNRLFTPFISALALGAALCLPAFAEEDAEEKVTIDKIPAAAAKALKEQAGDAKITELSKEKDEGKTVFEATFKKNGRVHDVTVDEKGKLLSDEETIPVGEAPAAIKEAIEREHAGAKIEKLERITEDGKTSYEALVSSKGKREEIKFDDKGKVVEREDKTNDKDKD